MERLHHPLHLVDADRRIVRIGRIGTLRRVVVLRVVPPVVPVGRELRLVDTVEVIARKNMDVCNAQLLEVVDSRLVAQRRNRSLLRKSQELTLVGNPRRGVDGEIAVVHLVEHRVGYIVDFRTLVLLPALRIGPREIYNRGAPAVDSDSLGPDPRGLVEPFAVVKHLEGIVLAHRRGVDFGGPGTVLGPPHIDSPQRLAATAVPVQPQCHPRRLRRPEPETCRALRSDCQSEVVTLVMGKCREAGVIAAVLRRFCRSGTAERRRGKERSGAKVNHQFFHRLRFLFFLSLCK